jgi:septum formation protein
MARELILASASNVRARMLADAGVHFLVQPAELDEGVLKKAYRVDQRDAADCALALAEAKARQVEAHRDHTLVIGADQILVSGEAWFDKPTDIAEARAQLQALRGRTHELVTAACAVQAGTRLWHAVSRPRLMMRDFTDDFLDDYIGVEEPAILGSVGAYRLEGRGVQLFEQIDGDHCAILGLPLLELLGFLRKTGEIRS